MQDNAPLILNFNPRGTSKWSPSGKLYPFFTSVNVSVFTVSEFKTKFCFRVAVYGSGFQRSDFMKTGCRKTCTHKRKKSMKNESDKILKVTFSLFFLGHSALMTLHQVTEV